MLQFLFVLTHSNSDKNHNPRKGTETYSSVVPLSREPGRDKNHNPRKGTETERRDCRSDHRNIPYDKNHNPRKGTETSSSAYTRSSKSGQIRTIIPARGRKHQPGRTAELLPVYEDKGLSHEGLCHHAEPLLFIVCSTEFVVCREKL